MSDINFSQCEEVLRSGKINTLEQLFELWKKAHKSEEKESFDVTKPKYAGLELSDDLKERFVPDGSLSSNENEKHRILFICRESNLSSSKNPEFWMRDVVDCKTKGKVMVGADATAKRSASKYYNCMEALARELKNSGILETCAYMNINKRGGFAGANFNRLGAYAKKYQNFIKREIEILQPELIVILGKLHNKDLRKLFESLQKDDYDIRQYKWHPSVWKKWKENSIPKTLLNKEIE